MFVIAIYIFVYNMSSRYTGCLATRVGRVQRDHRGGPLGMSDAKDRFANLKRLHKRGRRRGRRRCSDAARPQRVHVASVPRHGCRPGILLVQAVQQPVRAQTAVVLGTHQPWHCKYW